MECINGVLSPRVAFFEVTSMCTLKCLHCINSKTKSKDLKLKEVQLVLNKLKTGGIQLLKFTGGEPFERADFEEIVMTCEQLHINYMIYSNGMNLGFEWLGSLTHLCCLRVSFDGFQETHDYIRGKGNFELVISNLKKLISDCRNLRVQINYTINAMNYYQLIALDQYLTENAIDVSINLGFIKYAGKALEHKGLVFSRDSAERTLQIIQNDIERCSHINEFTMLSDFYLKHYGNFFGCPAAKEAIYIANNGDVYPCGMLKGNKQFYCGNVAKTKLEKVMDSAAMSSMKNINDIPYRCSQCEIFGIRCTGGCRGNAYNKLGEICGDDINCAFYDIVKKRNH